MTINLLNLGNPLALETLDDETLTELVQFRRETTEYHVKQGNKVQAIMHNAVLSALVELQECRKTDISEHFQRGYDDGHSRGISCGRLYKVDDQMRQHRAACIAAYRAEINGEECDE